MTLENCRFIKIQNMWSKLKTSNIRMIWYFGWCDCSGTKSRKHLLVKYKANEITYTNEKSKIICCWGVPDMEIKNLDSIYPTKTHTPREANSSCEKLRLFDTHVNDMRSILNKHVIRFAVGHWREGQRSRLRKTGSGIH